MAFYLVAKTVLESILAISMLGHPQGDFDPTPKPDELAFLPRYCQAKLEALDEVETNKWKHAIGEDWARLHHYCFALNYVNRANRARDELTRKRQVGWALGEFGYIRKHGSSAFPLWPELHVKSGDLLRMVGRDSEAAQEYIEAIKKRPGYTPAYSALADYYLDLGNKDEALRTIEDGLEHAPNSKMLKKKFLELSGNSQD